MLLVLVAALAASVAATDVPLDISPYKGPAADVTVAVNLTRVLQQQVQDLTAEVNLLIADFNGSDSGVLAQLQAFADQGRLGIEIASTSDNVASVQSQVDSLADRHANISSTLSELHTIYTCFAQSQCVSDAPTTAPLPTTPYPTSCPSAPAAATNTSQSFSLTSQSFSHNLNCTTLIKAGDKATLALTLSSVEATGSAQIIIQDAYSGQVYISVNSSTLPSVPKQIDTNSTVVQVVYSTVLNADAIAFSIDYVNADPCASFSCGKHGACSVDPTGAPFCTCDSPCYTGDHCQTDSSDHVCTDTLKRRCGEKKDLGTCHVDKDKCKFYCKCRDSPTTQENICKAKPTFTDQLQNFFGAHW